jgi:chromosome segregation ATPase
MKALRQLGFLKVNFRRDEAPVEDGRVLALFRNRAELKKAYGELQEEIYRLKDRIKQQEGATHRVQEMLETLEARLGVAETAYPALVFYQLRRLWQAARDLLARFVAELLSQQEERERRQHLAEHNRRQFARRQSVEQRVRGAEQLAAEESARLKELETRRSRLNRFWHYFQRRRLEPAVASSRAAVAAAELAVTTAREALAEIAREPVPDFPGVSLEARRAINLAAIAYAELLCQRLSKTRLVTLAREATRHRETTDEYGSPRDCEALMLQIERAGALLQDRGNVSPEIKQRSERIRQVARYRAPTDTTPSAESLAFADEEGGASEAARLEAARMPNVLAEDTWDLYSVLLR